VPQPHCTSSDALAERLTSTADYTTDVDCPTRWQWTHLLKLTAASTTGIMIHWHLAVDSTAADRRHTGALAAPHLSTTFFCTTGVGCCAPAHLLLHAVDPVAGDSTVCESIITSHLSPLAVRLQRRRRAWRCSASSGLHCGDQRLNSFACPARDDRHDGVMEPCFHRFCRCCVEPHRREGLVSWDSVSVANFPEDVDEDGPLPAGRRRQERLAGQDGKRDASTLHGGDQRTGPAQGTPQLGSGPSSAGRNNAADYVMRKQEGRSRARRRRFPDSGNHCPEQLVHLRGSGRLLARTCSDEAMRRRSTLDEPPGPVPWPLAPIPIPYQSLEEAAAAPWSTATEDPHIRPVGCMDPPDRSASENFGVPSFPTTSPLRLMPGAHAWRRISSGSSAWQGGRARHLGSQGSSTSACGTHCAQVGRAVDDVAGGESTRWGRNAAQPIENDVAAHDSKLCAHACGSAVGASE
jgi:hypothetical protein